MKGILFFALVIASISCASFNHTDISQNGGKLMDFTYSRPNAQIDWNELIPKFIEIGKQIAEIVQNEEWEKLPKIIFELFKRIKELFKGSAIDFGAIMEMLKPKTKSEPKFQLEDFIQGLQKMLTTTNETDAEKKRREALCKRCMTDPYFTSDSLACFNEYCFPPKEDDYISILKRLKEKGY